VILAFEERRGECPLPTLPRKRARRIEVAGERERRTGVAGEQGRRTEVVGKRVRRRGVACTRREPPWRGR
jgi:hypothetical protein